jgi:di/tricarboxylate transporter
MELQKIVNYEDEPELNKFKINKYKHLIGLIAGILAAVIILNIHIIGLKVQGQKCLALSLLGVIWWATDAIDSGYTSLMLLAGYMLLNIAPAEVVFSFWNTSTIYLIIGGFLIAAAVQISGLGKRIAYKFILKFVTSFNSLIISAYVLSFLLSFFIPFPIARAFLIMSVMSIVISTAHLPRRDAAIIGLAVFVGSIATSMIILTADSSINLIAANVGKQSLSWMGWLKNMGIPGAFVAFFTCFLQIKLFKPVVKFKLNKKSISNELAKLGSLTLNEKKTIFWVLLAVALWSTDSISHIEPGWISILIAVGFSLPVVGDILKPIHWKEVPLGTLFFLTASVSIGKVGDYTGMNHWIAATVLPNNPPSNIFIFAALVTVITLIIHICVGSVMTALSIATPALILYSAKIALNPLVPSLLVYTVASMQWILPFHNMTLLIGVGDGGGKYNNAEIAKLGIPLTLITFIVTIFIEIPWWKITGLI